MKKFALLALILAACGTGLEIDEDVPATGRTGGTMFPIHFPDPAPLKTGNGYSGIYYHGGPVLLGTTNVYYIWYGNWANNTAPTILTNLANNIGGSPYFNINTTYYNSNKQYVSNSVHFGGATTDNYSHGTALTDANIASIVSTALANNSLPTDTNGVYFVLTSADVNETSGFCTQYCGWHTNGTLNGKDIKYSFIGNAERCPNGCEPQQSISPNNNPGADAMASVISHELEETVTDPDLSGWYDRRGYENADKCAWTFGTQYTASNGSNANMNLGGLDYLIQRNWVNASSGYCALSY